MAGTKERPPERPPRPAAEQRALRCWVALARCFSSVQRRAEQLAREDGLTLPQFALLEALYHVGPLPLSEIGQKLLVSSGNVTYVVDNLEAAGWVERERCDTDRRVVYARLTPRGEALMDQAFPRHAQGIARRFAVLGAREQDELRALLRQLGLGEAPVE